MVSSLLKAGLSLFRMAKPKVIFVLGAPGAGKGTQCQKIVDTYEYVHLSAGDLLREERAKPDSEYGELIENYIQEGKIVPVEITCSLLDNAMKRSGKDKFLIDGFPRNQNNLDGWNETLADNINLLFVLFFDCPRETCVGRCLERGAAGSGRSDDNMQSLEKRFNTFIFETQPIVDFYKDRGLVRNVDATKSPEEVFEQVKEIFANVQAKESMEALASVYLIVAIVIKKRKCVVEFFPDGVFNTNLLTIGNLKQAIK